MRRMLLAAVAVVVMLGGGAVLAAPSGVNRVWVAKGTAGDVHIDAEGPVQVTHGVATIEAGGTTGWASWPGTLVATVKAGELGYRNASEDDCAARMFPAGTSFVVPAGSVFEAVNAGEETVEVYTVIFLPPGQTITAAEKPTNC